MAETRTILFTLLILISSYKTHAESGEDGYIDIDVSEKGLNFVKDLLINAAVSSLIPLELPQIEKAVHVPLVGNVNIVLSNISIYEVNVSSSVVQTGEGGITIVASGATAELSMNWEYSYSTWLFVISDSGVASVQVEGMEIGLTIGLRNEEGSLRVSLEDCGCYVDDISIKMSGGASWLYQAFIDVFEWKIASAVEDKISDEITDAVMKIDSVLGSVPKEIPIVNFASFNVTITNGPILSNTSLILGIDGLFTGKGREVTSLYYAENVQTSPYSCASEEKMVGIALDEEVLNSASLAYFNENSMNWYVDKIADQALLNTSEWKYIIPKLYKQFPNDDMTLNMTISSPPVIKVDKQNVVATIYSDVIINVLDGGEVVPVACISVEASTSLFAGISRNTLSGSVKLSKFSMNLKWSKIGVLHLRPIQSVISTSLKAFVLPVLNLRLKLGYPLPLFHGYKLQNAEIFCNGTRIVVCSDIAPANQYIPLQLY